MHTKNIEELYQNAKYSFHDSLENPFIHFHQHAKSCGLDYLDTESGWYSQDQKHKAISLNTPVGPIAYIHFKSNLKLDGSVVDDNTFHISSIGVIPPLRQKGIAKELYLLADENLGFNEETIIHRTSPSNKAPKEFTKKVYDITKDYKALYLDHYLTKYDFSFIEGFDDLPRKNQVNCLKELNDEYYKIINSKNNDKENEKYYILSELTYDDERKLLDNFKDKIKKESEFKQSKNKKTQNLSI